MPLYRTSRDKAHSHFVYVGPTGAVTSTAKKHTHPVTVVDGAVTGPDGRLVVPQGSIPTLDIVENEGHIHTVLVDQPLNKPISLPDESDQEVVSEVWRLWKAARELETDSMEKAEESEGFYSGEKQWEDAESAELDQSDRAVLTVNEIEPKIDILSGIQRQSRTTIHYMPVEGGDQRMADIYNLASSNILHNNDFDEQETDVFEDGCIGGRGIFNIYVTYNDDIEGDIKIERFCPKDVNFGPHSKKDLTDLEYFVKSRMFSESSAKAMWPKKADLVSGIVNRMEMPPKNGVVVPVDESNGNQNITIGGTKIIDIARKTFMVVECWRKMQYQSVVLYHETDDASFKAINWSDAELTQVLTIPGFISIPRVETYFRVTRIAGDVLLSDGIPRIWQGVNNFPIAVFYAKKRGDKYWGKIEPAKDLQREKNKRRSQLVDIVNKVASYGWFYDSNTFPTPQEKKKFVSSGSSPGFFVEVNDVGRPPQRVEGPKFPVEIAQLELASSDGIREIMNIPRELQGITQTGGESGVAILRKQRQGLVGNEFLFDNLSICKRRIGRIMLELIRQIYTPERIWRMVVNEAEKRGIPTPAAEMAREEIVSLIQNDDHTKYDIIVTESPDSPSLRQNTFIVLSELASRGYPVPPPLLIKYSDLPQEAKNEAMQSFTQQQQAEAQQAQDKNQTEIVKTQIAANAKQGGSTMAERTAPLTRQ